MLPTLDLLNDLAVQSASDALTDGEAAALSDRLAKTSDKLMRRRVINPADLLEKIAVVRICTARGWDAKLPGYLARLEDDIAEIAQVNSGRPGGVKHE